MSLKKIRYSRNLLTEKLIFVGGVTRCGKSFLLPLVSSLKKTEMFFCNSIAENIYFLNYLKLIDDKTASYLFRNVYNEKIYNLNIGRELSKRKFDYSSIRKYKNPNIYFQREKSKKEGDVKIKEIKKESNNYPIMFHNVLLKPEFIFKSFPKSKVIFIDRHPVDLIFEWIEKKYYGKFYSSPRCTTPSFELRKKTYPFWCYGYEKEFVKLNNVNEKTIFLFEKLYVVQKKNYLRFKKKYPKNLLLVKFKELVEKTSEELKIIEKFLNIKKSKFTSVEIKKQKGNRKNTDLLRKNKRDKILKNISDKYKIKLIELEKLHKKK
tara:strand:- start:981 stop:1943 length:963 start_codon:yes stop_codon:yes gene_type:complete